MIYKWKNGARMKSDPQKVGEEIESLGKEIKAWDVVAAAEKKTSAMHNEFLWNDEKAAEEYRLEQARSLMRSLVTVIDAPDQLSGSITVRAYENVELGEGLKSRNAYVSTKKVLSIPELREQVIGRLDDEIREAEQTAAKYQYLCKQFEEVKKRLGKAREALPVQAGMARYCVDGFGRARSVAARYVKVRRGLARQLWYGAKWSGKAWYGE